jgi:2-oxoglutarate ferredoxin oxidoreductase subunit alpha
MLNDVLLAVKGRAPVQFYGRPGGVVPFPDQILTEIEHRASTPTHVNGDPRKAWLERMTA